MRGCNMTAIAPLNARSCALPVTLASTAAITRLGPVNRTGAVADCYGFFSLAACAAAGGGLFTLRRSCSRAAAHSASSSLPSWSWS